MIFQQWNHTLRLWMNWKNAQCPGLTIYECTRNINRLFRYTILYTIICRFCGIVWYCRISKPCMASGNFLNIGNFGILWNCSVSNVLVPLSPQNPLKISGFFFFIPNSTPIFYMQWRGARIFVYTNRLEPIYDSGWRYIRVGLKVYTFTRTIS